MSLLVLSYERIVEALVNGEVMWEQLTAPTTLFAFPEVDTAVLGAFCSDMNEFHRLLGYSPEARQLDSKFKHAVLGADESQRVLYSMLRCLDWFGALNEFLVQHGHQPLPESARVIGLARLAPVILAANPGLTVISKKAVEQAQAA